MDTLTIEYKEKSTGLHFVQFDADQNINDKKIDLWCNDDDTGAHDVSVTRKELAERYEEIKRYMEES